MILPNRKMLGTKLLGLAIITASCSKASNAANNKKKWICVTLAPTILTMLVYAVSDRSKFQGYSSAHDTPLSNWSDGSFGLAEFGELFGGSPRPHWFYVIRLIFSITINISSVLLVLIDAVCLEVGYACRRRGAQWLHILFRFYVGITPLARGDPYVLLECAYLTSKPQERTPTERRVGCYLYFRKYTRRSSIPARSTSQTLLEGP